MVYQRHATCTDKRRFKIVIRFFFLSMFFSSFYYYLQSLVNVVVAVVVWMYSVHKIMVQIISGYKLYTERHKLGGGVYGDGIRRGKLEEPCYVKWIFDKYTGLIIISIYTGLKLFHYQFLLVYRKSTLSMLRYCQPYIYFVIYLALFSFLSYQFRYWMLQFFSIFHIVQLHVFLFVKYKMYQLLAVHVRFNFNNNKRRKGEGRWIGV